MATIRRAAKVAGKFRAGLVGPKVACGSFPHGCAVWLDATDDTTISHVANAVSSWRNKVSTGQSFDQSSGAQKPTRVVAGGAPMNGLQHIDFDGGDILSYVASGIASGSSGEIWWSAQQDTAGIQAIYSQIPGGSVSYVIAYIDGTATSKPRIAADNASPNLIDVTVAHSTGTVYIQRMKSTGSAYSIETNGVADTLVVASGANDGRWYSAMGAMNSSNVGGHLASGVPTQQYDGKLGELFVVDGRTLSANEATTLRAYLTSKWT